MTVWLYSNLPIDIHMWQQDTLTVVLTVWKNKKSSMTYHKGE